MLAVFVQLDRVGAHGPAKSGEAVIGVEFVEREENDIAARGAHIHAGLIAVPILTRVRCLRAPLAHYAILFGRKFLFEVFILHRHNIAEILSLIPAS